MENTYLDSIKATGPCHWKSNDYFSSHFYYQNLRTSFLLMNMGGSLTKLIYLNFQPLEVVSRYRDPQPQVVYENY